MRKFNETLSHQREYSDKMAMIARKAPARVLARLSLSVRAKKPYRNPENLISAGLATGDHYALKSGKLVYLLTLIPLVSSLVLVRYVYILSVGGERLSVHLARQLQNMNSVSYQLERV